MLNAKPIGPEVVVLVSYDGNWVYKYEARDDDGELNGLRGTELVKAIAESLVEVVTPSTR